MSYYRRDRQNDDSLRGDIEHLSELVGKLAHQLNEIEDKLDTRVKSLEQWRAYLVGAWAALVIVGAILKMVVK